MKTEELGIIDLVEFQENSGNRREKMGVNSDYAIEVVEFIQCVILACSTACSVRLTIISRGSATGL